ENQFPVGSKPEIADMIANLGVSVIEAGFPRTEGDREQVEEVARTIGNKTYRVDSWVDGKQIGIPLTRPVIAGLCRTTPEDVEVTWDAVQHAKRPRIHTFISTDPEHMASKFPGKTPDEVLAMGVNAVEQAKALTLEHPSARVEFSAEAASTTEPKYLERVVKSAVYAGADVINVPDTVGERDPFWMYNFYRGVIRWVKDSNPEVTISAHNHNDLGNAAPNSLALVRAAVDHSTTTGESVDVQIESTITGLGERAGNADLFTVIGNLFKAGDDGAFEAPVGWKFNPRFSVITARQVLSFAGLEVNRQHPIVGSDVVTHRSGIHSDGVLKGGFRIYTPTDMTFYGHDVNARHEEGMYQGAKGRAAAIAGQS
ncbi:MAG: LeuA family protein, partial [Candidatus Saccharimonadales bacterium]